MEQSTISAYEQAVKDLEDGGHYSCFDIQGIQIGFYTDEAEDISWLVRSSIGYFPPSDNKKVDAIIYSTRNPQTYGALLTTLEDQNAVSATDYSVLPINEDITLVHDSKISKRRSVGNICYVMSKPDRRLLVSFTGPAQDRRTLIMFTLRNFAKLLLVERSWLPFHAASFTMNGVGVCIAGGKFAGKTSTLINLLTNKDITLVTNDKIYLHDAGTHIDGYGFPNKTGIRVGTILSNPKLMEWVKTFDDPFYPQPFSQEEIREILATTPMEELKNRSDKVVLSPDELTNLFGRTINPNSPITHIVLSNYDPSLSESRLVPVEKERVVAEMLPHYRSLVKEKQKFLQMFFSLNDDIASEQFSALFTRYLDGIQVYQLYQNERTNADTARLLDELTRQYTAQAA